MDVMGGGMREAGEAFASAGCAVTREPFHHGMFADSKSTQRVTAPCRHRNAGWERT